MDHINIDKILYNSFNYNNQYIITNEIEFNVHNEVINMVDISNNFPKIYDQCKMGITSSCAIVSIMSYYLKKVYNIDKLFSPYYLAFHQYNVTKSWESIDLFTGLNISNNFGICSDYLVNDQTNYNDINLDFISNDANKYRFGYFSKINFNINNIEKLLNDKTPILCSIKILPDIDNINQNNKFYNNFKNNNYWLNVDDYYKQNINVYSVSIVIVGYDTEREELKIRGCWGNQVGDDGYFYINYKTINMFNSLFFDHYIINSILPIASNTNNLEMNLSDIIVSDDRLINENIYQLNKVTTTLTKTKSFNKVSSLSSLNDTIIKIDSYDDLNQLFEDMKQELSLSNNYPINVY